MKETIMDSNFAVKKKVHTTQHLKLEYLISK